MKNILKALSSIPILYNLSPEQLENPGRSLSDKQTRKTHVDLNISKGDLAGLIGSIPETLSRAFSKLSAQGLIRVEGQKNTLLAKSRLRNLSETR
jgi:CRP/FNR family transcriptional regulator